MIADFRRSPRGILESIDADGRRVQKQATKRPAPEGTDAETAPVWGGAQDVFRNTASAITTKREDHA